MQSIPTVTSQTNGQTNLHAPLVPRGRMLPFVLVTALFFLWAIPNNFNDILIRQFMKSFEINRLEAGLVQFAFYLGYFFLAYPAGVIMRRAGYKTGIVIGLCLYGAGCILFYPAAHVGQYWFFLTALFVIASGLAFLETGASPFIIQIGDPASAAQRVNFSQSFNPLGSITAVLIGSRFIFSGIELKPDQVAALQAAGTYQAYLKSETLRVVTPYLVLGSLVLLWAILIARTPFPHTGMDYSRNTLEHDTSKPLWKRKHFVFAVLAQFLYVGAQVGAWSWQIPYVQSYTGMGERKAGYLLTVALVAFTTGRFFSTWLLRHVKASRLLAVYAIINTITCGVAVIRPGWLGVGCLVATSFFMSMMFPTIFALGVKGLGTHTKTGGAVIVMSIVGGAAIPLVMGRVGDMEGLAVSYVVPALCFAAIALYAWLGSAPDQEELAAEPGLALG
ncbi:L-fucose:H+ symporter permease [Occallatibacter riparius]|uniref:L-fucose:H+ symporter permease n=1 Tax=Occallatibacter riparius TaxID=1002689 RepID=A0A9J7BJK7_9BACT|nr:L-fucose:H+ symporter permease [Occallatibacter riparius]UWZ82863.1 L-fucose:H+ symporter permease [Occallatibacter riparius]